MVADRTYTSPNRTGGGLIRPVKAIVIHATRSGQGPRNWSDDKETSATVNWFLNSSSQVSSHWIVNGAGEKIRMVPDADAAWHAGQHNPYAVGIELTQPLTDTPYTDGHYRSLVEVCKTYPGVPVRFLAHFTNGGEGYTGHENSAQGLASGKSDPGRQFDWNRFLEMMKEDDTMTDAERQELADLRAELNRLKALVHTGGIFMTVAGKALQGEDAGQDANEARALLGPG